MMELEVSTEFSDGDGGGQDGLASQERDAPVQPQGWMQDLVHGVAQSREPQRIFAHVAGAAKALGFTHCAYGLRHPLPLAQPRFALLNTYDASWRRRYEEAGYLAADPVVAHGAHSLEPVVWTDDLFRHARPMWEEARAEGLVVGWSQSCFDAVGAGGMLSLARDREYLSPAELRAKEPALRWLVNVAHVALAASLARHASPPLLLTEREEQVLRWTADGKTSPEIAQILELSVNTVNYHFKGALTKLGASTKAAAVALWMARSPRS